MYWPCCKNDAAKIRQILWRKRHNIKIRHDCEKSLTKFNPEAAASGRMALSKTFPTYELHELPAPVYMPDFFCNRLLYKYGLVLEVIESINDGYIQQVRKIRASD